MKNKIVKQLLGISVATILFAQMPVLSLAADYDIGNGSIIVDSDADGVRIVTQAGVPNDPETTETVISGTSTSNTITINSSGTGENAAKVTIRDLNIDVSNTGSDEYPLVTGEAAIKTTGAGNIDIELDGTNTLASGALCGGLQKENEGTLTIKDEIPSPDDIPDSLTAIGGDYAAGIGGGIYKLGSDITIEGGVITATGGVEGAGIGGGAGANSGGSADTDDTGGTTSITIKGGVITATGGEWAAGIGGGSQAGLLKTGGADIIIEGGEVTATGGKWAAGIGGGLSGFGTVTIEGGEVTATGGLCGAGIGGGNGSGILGTVTIEGGEVTATGGDYGAGIGGGAYGNGKVTIKDGIITATGGLTGAGIGGSNATDSSLKVSGSAVVKVSGGAEYELQNYGAGAAVGERGTGKKINNVWTLVEGSYIDIDTTELGESGCVIFYKPGTSVQSMIEHPTNNLYLEHPYIGQLPFAIDSGESVIIPGGLPKQNNDNSNRLDTDDNRSDNNDSNDTPTYQGITPDSLIRQINGLMRTSVNGEITIDFGRNICLTPELMKVLFETGNVAKNCTFTYMGKRYNLYIPVIDTKSDKYIKAMEELKKEDNGKGFAGFMRTKDIFKELGVTLSEIK